MARMQPGDGEEFFGGGLLLRSRIAKIAQSPGGLDSHILGRNPRGNLDSARSVGLPALVERRIPRLRASQDRLHESSTKIQGGASEALGSRGEGQAGRKKSAESSSAFRSGQESELTLGVVQRHDCSSYSLRHQRRDLVSGGIQRRPGVFVSQNLPGHDSKLARRLETRRFSILVRAISA